MREKMDVEQHMNNWTLKAQFFHAWLERLQQELDAPDLWASIGQEKVLSIVASSPSIGNRPFSLEEQRMISQN
jgi:hypothetical protein